MIKIIIDEKITPQQLAEGTNIDIEFYTDFNEGISSKKYPDHFSNAERDIIKQLYDMAICQNEIGNKVYIVQNIDKSITINGFKRLAPDGEPQEDFDNQTEVSLEFISHGINRESRIITGFYNQEIPVEDILILEGIGINVIGRFNSFNITNHSNDMSLKIVKDKHDSFVDQNDFKNGEIIFTK